MCVCVCVCVYICVYMYIFICVCIYIYMYIYVYIIYIYIIYIHIYILHIYIHIYVCIYICSQPPEWAAQLVNTLARQSCLFLLLQVRNVREHRSRGGERHAEYVCRRKQGRKEGHKAPQERTTQRAAESGPQGTAQAVTLEDRKTHTGNTQTRKSSEWASVSPVSIDSRVCFLFFCRCASA